MVYNGDDLWRLYREISVRWELLSASFWAIRHRSRARSLRFYTRLRRGLFGILRVCKPI